jgi:SAM-dependent methyltransferase
MSKYSKVRKNSSTSLKDTLGKVYSYIPNSPLVLDVGCSTGYFGELLIDDKKATVDGIELDSNDAAKARKVLNQVYSLDLEYDEWPKELLSTRYDVVFFGDILEHLKDPGKVLEKFSKLLKRSGIVIISIPNIAHASVRFDLLAGNFDYEELGILDNTHLKYFTFSSFTRLLGESGYKLIDYDQSTVAMPRDTAEKILDNLGLVANEKFYDRMLQPDATAFQYKIVAKVGKMKAPPKLSKKTLETAKRQAVKVQELYSKINELNNKLEKTEQELLGAHGSISWRITKPLRKAKSVVKGNK